MILYITAIQLQSGTQHQHIASVPWLSCSDGTSDVCATAAMVEWLEKTETNQARVADAKGSVAVGIWEHNSRKYLRTHADQRWTDNLLALPRY